jgi:2-oxoglutarate dehydrogenase complex dehydrogenase (E1) component-like enzyme
MMKKMTIQDLINMLEKVDDKNMAVNFHAISNNHTQKEVVRVSIEKARNTATIIVK